MTPDSKKPGRTLQQMIADATRREGIRCPRCGCPDLAVKVTWKAGGQVKRRRVCDNCGAVVPTMEARI